MNSPSIKQFNLRPIYTALAISFALLVFLIWMIGTKGSSELSRISDNAGESANDYVDRLELALNIREAAAEVITAARLYRAREVTKIQVLPFGAKLGPAKKRLQQEIGKGRVLWGKRKEYQTAREEELAAWREVEEKSQIFLEYLAILETPQNREDEDVSSNQNQPGEQPRAASPNATRQQTQQESSQKAQLQTKADQDEFLNRRNELHNATTKLMEIVSKTQNDTLRQFADRQQEAATEVSGARWWTLLVGLVVATLTLIIVRNQIIQFRQASRQEQEARDFASSIFNSQSNDIIVVNNGGELLEVNKAFLNHFQLPAPSLVLQDYRAALAHLPEVAAFVGKTLEQPDDNSSLRERIEVKPRYEHNGQSAAEARLFDIYVTPLMIGGQLGGRVVVIVDVTEAEKVREELRRSRTLSAVGQITATVAHELYNPIGAVKLNLDLLEMQLEDDGAVKHTVARLKRGVEHLSTIVMDLRYLTRPRDPDRKTTDLNKLLDEVVELAGDRLERSRVCVTRDYAARLPQGQYDQQQLRKVFLNLLVNAVEASPQNSDVELQTRYLYDNGAPAENNGARGSLVISVIDRGVGMSAETKRRLFEAFYTTKRNGTGLGMMITQEIVKKHGGKIEVESEEGRGTTVSVYLPV